MVSDVYTITNTDTYIVSHSQTATFLLCGGGKSRVWYNDNRNPVQASPVSSER